MAEPLALLACSGQAQRQQLKNPYVYIGSLIELGNWLDPELELDLQLGLQLLWAEFELEAELELTVVADVESRRPHLELELEPGSWPVMAEPG